MRVKEWLRQGRELRQEIEQLQKEKLDMWDMLTNTVQGFEEKVQTSKKQGDEKIIKYLEYDELISKKVQELQKTVNDIERAIERLSKPRHRKLMRYYYIDRMTWEQVAERMNIDVRWVYILHGRALEEMDEIINK